MPAAQQRRAANFRRSVQDRAHERAVLVGRRGHPLARRHERGPGRRQEHRSRATSRSRSRRPASACCWSTPTCGGRACTRSSSCRRSPGSRTCSSATPRPSEAIRKSSVQGLWLLPAGTFRRTRRSCSARSASRTSSRRSEHFDWVIIDSPPVLVVTDASIVANQATGVVFVVGADQTSRHAATRRGRAARRRHAHIIGAVLNRVDVERQSVLLLVLLPEGIRRYYARATEQPQPPRA